LRRTRQAVRRGEFVSILCPIVVDTDWEFRYNRGCMDPDVPVFESEAPEPEKKRRGVTVITQYGRAVTFGVSQTRTEHFLKTIAQRNDHELMAAMQEQKATRLKTKPAAGRGQ
jgi:uncharacterized Rmd1/YagE family protein